MKWNEILPLVGVIIGGLLTWGGQALTDRRALRRDELTARRAAEAQVKAEWLLHQREAIREVQEIIETMAAIRTLDGRARIRASVAEDAAAGSRRIHTVLARLDDRQLATDIAIWLKMDFATAGAINDHMQALQSRLGEALRATHS